MKTPFSKYLKSILDEKNISMYELYKRLGGNHRHEGGIVSYPHITQVVKGTRGTPKPAILKEFSRAMQVPYTDLLKAAGYITESDHQDINEMLRDMLKPMFDDNIVDVLCDEKMLEILGDIMKVDGENRQTLINGLRTFARGFVGDKDIK